MRKILVLAVLILIISVIGIGWWNNALQPASPENNTFRTFVVSDGVGVRELGNRLKKEGLIKDPVVFFLYVRKEGLDKKIQAGDFRLSPSMSVTEIVNELQHGSADKWITVREGVRASEIAEILEESFVTYESSWDQKLEDEEGFLFPDTYRFPREASIEMIINTMKNTYEQKVASLGIEDPYSPAMSEAVTMASLIERESRVDSEKPLIASVIQNRIDDGVALDIDATLQYIVGKKNGKWWNVPTGEEKAVKSPYNTYQNPGLPPGPICNPGIESIRAALNPAESEYYFYIHEPSGQVHFAKTLQEHNVNVDKYLR